MKKYLMGLVAVVVMAIGLSAFTQKHSTKNKKLSGTYFWYNYTAGTDQLGSMLNPVSTVKITKQDALDLTTCEDEVSPDCVRAYNENNRAGQLHPPAPLDRILHSN